MMKMGMTRQGSQADGMENPGGSLIIEVEENNL
jgi:hypothetical protein